MNTAQTTDKAWEKTCCMLCGSKQYPPIYLSCSIRQFTAYQSYDGRSPRQPRGIPVIHGRAKPHGIYPDKPLYVYVINLTLKPINLTKFIIVAQELSVPVSNIKAH